MNYRNPIYNHLGTIDCEIDHPDHGWIPFTASPGDVEPAGVALHTQIVLDGGIAPYVPDLTSLKKAARYKIDQSAEHARLRYITNGAGQALVYQKKEDEARAYVLAGYPADTSNYPFVEAEMNATGKSKEAAADDIIIKADAWVVVGANIEEERLSGKAAVDVATIVADIETARGTAIAALDAI